MATVKKGKPELRKKVLQAVVIRQKKAWRRREGTFIYFEDNAGVIVNEKGELKGSAITGPIAKECGELWAKIASAAAVDGYTPESFDAALKASKVDMSMLSASLSELPDPAKKLAVKLAMDSAKMTKAIEAGVTMPDWAAAEAKIGPEIVAEIKALCEAEIASAQKDMEASTAFAEVEKEMKAAFEGPGGLFELASKEEKAAEAGMAQCLEAMKKVEVDAGTVATVTVAEILEREPELRAEIEEELKNNVWAP
jgi:hypothetical protein